MNGTYLSNCKMDMTISHDSNYEIRRFKLAVVFCYFKHKKFVTIMYIFVYKNRNKILLYR